LVTRDFPLCRRHIECEQVAVLQLEGGVAVDVDKGGEGYHDGLELDTVRGEE